MNPVKDRFYYINSHQDLRNYKCYAKSHYNLRKRLKDARCF